MKRLILLLATMLLVLTGCFDKEDDQSALDKARNEGYEAAKGELQAQLELKDKMLDKSRAEGKAQAEEEFKIQMANLDKLVAKARAEGVAQAEAQLSVQMDNMESLVAKARAEGRAQALEDVKAQNDNLNKRAQSMEEELAQRHKFFQGTSGTYSGKAYGPNGNPFMTKITLTPSLPPYPSNGRVRTVEEVTHDLNNLYFNAEVLDTDVAGTIAAGCIFKAVRPDLKKGTIHLVSEDCRKTYHFAVSDLTEEKSDAVAARLVNGSLDTAPGLKGKMISTVTAGTYTFSLKREKDE
jgi:hypothetical protein